MVRTSSLISVFVTLRYFERFSPLIESLSCLLQNDVHTVRNYAKNVAGEGGGVSDVIQHERLFLDFSLLNIILRFPLKI